MPGLEDQLSARFGDAIEQADAQSTDMSEAEAAKLGLSKLHGTLGKRTQELNEARGRIAELEASQAAPAPASAEQREAPSFDPTKRYQWDQEEQSFFEVAPPTPRGNNGQRELPEREPSEDDLRSELQSVFSGGGIRRPI
jgi:hypothetical protein